MSFDITFAFDQAEYLNAQFDILIESMKGKVPEDTIIHLVTNRREEDRIVKKMEDNFNTKYYHVHKDNYLDSRCRYMLNCFKIDSDKKWIIKMESDFIILRHLKELENILDNGYDTILEPENRYLFNNLLMKRIYRHNYKALGIKCPDNVEIEYRENKEKGIPLFGTGMICVKNNILETINKRWTPLTKVSERWMDYGTHPNEMAFTSIIFDEGWKWKLYPDIYKYNPIGHFRKGEFPSIELIENCKLPEETVIFDYHRPKWLMHVSKYNKSIGDILCKCDRHIPDDWWRLSNKDFMETIQ